MLNLSHIMFSLFICDSLQQDAGVYFIIFAFSLCLVAYPTVTIFGVLVVTINVSKIFLKT